MQALAEGIAVLGEDGGDERQVGLHVLRRVLCAADCRADRVERGGFGLAEFHGRVSFRLCFACCLVPVFVCIVQVLQAELARVAVCSRRSCAWDLGHPDRGGRGDFGEPHVDDLASAGVLAHLPALDLHTLERVAEFWILHVCFPFLLSVVLGRTWGVSAAESTGCATAALRICCVAACWGRMGSAACVACPCAPAPPTLPHLRPFIVLSLPFAALGSGGAQGDGRSHTA